MQARKAWFLVLTFMFFCLYGFEAPRVLAEFVTTARVAELEDSLAFWAIGVVFAITVAVLMLFFARRDFD